MTALAGRKVEAVNPKHIHGAFECQTSAKSIIDKNNAIVAT